MVDHEHYKPLLLLKDIFWSQLWVPSLSACLELAVQQQLTAAIAQLYETVMPALLNSANITGERLAILLAA